MLSNLSITTPAGQTASAKKGCGCGCSDSAVPELKATSLPKAIRHGAIIGGLTSLPPGQQLILVAPHDPKPLLAQLQETLPGGFEHSYLAEGPDDWRLLFTRR